MQRMESDVPNEVIMEQHEFKADEEGKTPEELQQDKENNADDVQF